MRITARIACYIAWALATGCSDPYPAGSSKRYAPSSTSGSGGTAPTAFGTGGTGAPGSGSGGTIGPLNPGFDGGPGAFGAYTDSVVLADPDPPPISGGTLTLIAGGHKAAVADPDRDQVVVVDLDAMSVVATITLRTADEPGRVVEDGAGRVHVVLRRAGAVVTLDAKMGVELSRRAVCPHPRGLAYDPKRDALHIACVGGEFVTLPAGGGGATRVLHLDRDLRDVVVDGDRLLVSRFRAAELLVVDAAGNLAARLLPFDPPPQIPGERLAESRELRAKQLSTKPLPTPSEGEPLRPRFPAVAWRTVAAPGGGAIMVFQLTQRGELARVGGGWGGPCRHIVDTAVSWVRVDGLAWTIENVRAVLPVDVAISADGASIAVASAAVTTVPLGAPTFQPFETLGAPSVGTRSSLRCGWSGGGPARLALDEDPKPAGRVVALAYDGEGRLIVQTREPSALVRGGQSVALPGASRKHTGHELFHFATEEALACASCHPEGQDDGQVWTFPGQGERRTQNVSGGILGTEPFHWNGDMADFEMLVRETFNRRMSGPALQAPHVNALARWIDKIPRPAGIAPGDPPAAERGHAIFVDSAVGCGTCHAGAKLTNSGTFDVQTGGAFQVPSLLGLAVRAPYLHTGCAATLAERFGSCGGGDAHGHISGLTAQNLADLVAYLETL
jgi:hypothetical protein